MFKKKFNDPNVDHDYIWPTFVKLNGNPLLQYNCHVGWHYSILFRWITVVATSMKQLNKAQNVHEFIRAPEENWK